jgi:hypothetical protein
MDGMKARADAGRRTLKRVTSSQQNRESEATPEHRGPSWALMLFLILLAMLVAVVIAWSFIRHFQVHP